MRLEILIDKWERNIDQGKSLILDETRIENYLKMLDGKTSTQIVVISKEKKTSLLIGGGNHGQYVVTITMGNDEVFYNLLKPLGKEDLEVELVTGGQAGLFLDKYCVDFNTALEAFTYYAHAGEKSPDLEWEES